MPITYKDSSNKDLIAHLAPGVTPVEAAEAMHLADGTWREITEAEAAELQKPTPEEQQAALLSSFTTAIQAHLDTFARTRNYDGIMSAATYATSTVPKFKAEGQYAVEARDATWNKGYEIMGAVMAGERPMPTWEEILTELPALTWPV